MQLIPTHNKLRNIQTYRHFVRRFERGLGWTERKYGIPIIVTEDSKCWLFDGTHEVVAATYCGITVPANVLNIIRYNYHELFSINYNIGYITPFDPKIECRLSFHDWKFKTLKMVKEISHDMTTNYILNNRHLYVEPRISQTIFDLIPKF